MFQTLATDTFDDYEDMQGVPLMDVKRQDPRSQVHRACLVKSLLFTCLWMACQLLPHLPD